MSKLRWVSFFEPYSNFLATAVAIGAIYFFGYIWRLGNLLPGASAEEYQSIHGSTSLTVIWQKPLYLPYELLQHLLLKLNISTLLSGRLASAIFTAILALAFFYVLRCWFGKPTALVGLVLFLTNPYSLILGRTATPKVLEFSLVFLMAAYSWALQSSQKSKIAWLLFCFSLAFCLYTPGLVWLILPGLIFIRRELITVFSKIPREFLAGGVILTIVLLLPLLLSLFASPSTLKSFLLLPDHWPKLLSAIKYFGWSFFAIFIKTPTHTNDILGRSPMLGIAELALTIFGTYALAKRLFRVVLLIGLLFIPILLLSAINQSLTTLYVLLPVLLALAAVGVRFFYVDWRRVFPLNPLPKYLCVALISALVIVHVIYGFRYALTAWPHNSDTQAAYVLKL